MKFTLDVDQVQYGVPDFYTVDQWAKLQQWNFSDKDEWPFIISAATGAPAKGIMEVYQEDPEMLEFMLSIVFASLNLFNLPLQKELEGYKLIDLDNISIGTFIDLDVLASDKTKFGELFARLMEMPIDIAKSHDVKLAIPIVNYYFKWRRSVYQSYKALFDVKDQEQADSDYKPTMSSAHSWYETIMTLADGQFDKIDYIVRRPYREAFNWLAWRKTKVAEEKMEIMKLQNSYKKK
jgi:hypothetical protein